MMPLMTFTPIGLLLVAAGERMFPGTTTTRTTERKSFPSDFFPYFVLSHSVDVHAVEVQLNDDGKSINKCLRLVLDNTGHSFQVDMDEPTGWNASKLLKIDREKLREFLKQQNKPIET